MSDKSYQPTLPGLRAFVAIAEKQHAAFLDTIQRIERCDALAVRDGLARHPDQAHLAIRSAVLAVAARRDEERPASGDSAAYWPTRSSGVPAATKPPARRNTRTTVPCALASVTRRSVSMKRM